VTILGTAPPRQTLRSGNAGTGILVESDDSRVLLDCGPGVTERIDRAGVDVRSIDTLLLTHHHWDHISDLPMFVLGRWEESLFGSADDGRYAEPLTIIGPVGTCRIGELLFGDRSVFAGDIATRLDDDIGVALYGTRGVKPPFPDPIGDVRDIEAGATLELADVTVTTAEVEHCAPHLKSLAYRISSPGGVVVFSGDSAPTSSVAELARSADVLLHDCGMSAAVRAALGRTAIHSTPAEVGRIAASAGVGLVVAVHHHTAPDDERGRADLEREIRASFQGDIRIAREGETLAVERTHGAA
jgi:ribonuclease Z